MADKPILFSGPMVRALLDGSKTQTRRVVKQPGDYYGFIGCREYSNKKWYYEYVDVPTREIEGYEVKLPYAAGDRLYPPESSLKWQPSIFMPRWASRITLVVTGVKVEPLQEITWQDIVAEGFPRGLIDDFADYWDSLHAKRHDGQYVWSNNPWVAAISFEVRKRNIDRVEASHE